MFGTIRDLIAHRRLLREFVVRDLKARYVGSSMGFFWSVIFPLLNLAVYFVVFRLIMEVRFGDKMSPEASAMWMLSGITVWTAFAETVSRSTNCLVENTNLIQKVVFPSEVLPAFLTVSSLINMLIGIPLVLLGVGFFILKGDTAGFVEVETASLAMVDLQIMDPGPDRTLKWGVSMLCLPLLMLAQGVFTLGLGYFLSTLNLFLRDTYHLVGVLVTFWMFATPIFYPVALVEQARGGQFAFILDINPMHWLIESYREVLLFGEWPGLHLIGPFLLVALFVFAAGATFFRSQKARFPDLL